MNKGGKKAKMGLPNLSYNVYRTLKFCFKAVSLVVPVHKYILSLFSASYESCHRADNDRRKDAKSKKATGEEHKNSSVN